jgi:hypothetical protein
MVRISVLYPNEPGKRWTTPTLLCRQHYLDTLEPMPSTCGVRH